jgi:hypothetical protein
MGRVSPQAPIKSRLGRPSGAPGKPTSQRNDTQSIVAGVRPSKCPDILTVVAFVVALKAAAAADLGKGPPDYPSQDDEPCGSERSTPRFAANYIFGTIYPAQQVL